MNIKFKDLKITNFLSLGSVQLNLENNNFVLVEGINNCSVDNAKSNGSGKSSLFEALIWCLTGETVRGTKDVRNLNASSGTCVELEFTLDNNDYSITRFRDDPNYGNNLKILKNGKDESGKGIRDSEKILSELLPDLTAQLLGSVIILGQGLPQRFTNNTPAGRKEILEKLSKSDYMIEDVKNKLNDRKVNVQTELRQIEDTILSKTSTISSLESNNNKIDLELNGLRPEEELTKEILSIDSEINDILILLDVDRKEVEYISTEINMKTEEKINALDKFEKEYAEKSKPLREEIFRHESEKSTIQGSIKQLQNEIYSLQNVKTHCPTCGRPYDDVHKPDTSSQEAQLLTKQKELSDKQEILEAFNTQYKELSNTYSTLETDTKNNFDKEIKELNDKKRFYETSATVNISKKDNLQKEKDKYVQQLTVVTTQKDLLLKTKSDNESLIAKNKEDVEALRKEADLINTKLDVLQKMLTTAQREFRTYLLEDIVYFINQRVIHYSKRLFNSDLAEFKSEGNQIWIGYNGKQYENLSGGEKQKIDLIVQFAIRDMLMTLLNFSCNLLVLDEVFDNLDKQGCDNLITLILNELKDVNSVYIITHHSDISIPYDNIITIVKEDPGISYLT